MEPSIQTISNRVFDYRNPGAYDFSIHEIAHALSHLCRFTGHCKEFYSVAQHSVLVSHVVKSEDPKVLMAALLHDAAEAYLGDVNTPLKRMLPDYEALERRVEAAIFTQYSLPYPLPDCVKEADLVMLATEKRDLLAGDVYWPCLEGVEPRQRLIAPWAPGIAREAFVRRFTELTTRGENLIYGDC